MSQKFTLKGSLVEETEDSTCCAVPGCGNDAATNPEKCFYAVPFHPPTRTAWLNFARIELYVSTNANIYFCEDHFKGSEAQNLLRLNGEDLSTNIKTSNQLERRAHSGLPEDMENYMQYHVMGSVAQVHTKPGCIPRRFESLTSETIEQLIVKEQKKMKMIQENYDRMVTKHLELGETSEMSESHLPAAPEKYPMSLLKPFAAATASTELSQLNSQSNIFEGTSFKPLLLTKSKKTRRKRKRSRNGSLDLESDVNTDDEVDDILKAMQDVKQAKQRKSRAKKHFKHQESNVEDVVNNIVNAIQYVQYAKVKKSRSKISQLAGSENSPFSYIAKEHDYAQSKPPVRQKKKRQSKARKPVNIRNQIKLHQNFLCINEDNCFAKQKSVQLPEDNEETDSADAIKTFCCRYCLIEFVDEGYLLQHVQEEHSNIEEESLEIKPEIFQCNKCPSSFIAVEDMSEHQQIMHGDLIEHYLESCKSSPKNIKSKKNYDKTYENYNETQEVENIVTVEQSSENYKDVQITVEVKRETIDSFDDVDIGLHNLISSQISLNDFDQILGDNLIDLNGTGVPDFRIHDIRGSYDKSNDSFENENSISSSANSILEDVNSSMEITENLRIYRCNFCFLEYTTIHELYVHCAISHPQGFRNVSNIQCKRCLKQFKNEVELLEHMHEAFNTKSHCYSKTSHCYSKTELKSDIVLNEAFINTHNKYYNISRDKTLQPVVVLEKLIIEKKNSPKKDLENPSSTGPNDSMKKGAHADKIFTMTSEEVFDGDENELLTPLREEDERVLVAAFDPSACKSCLKPLETNVGNELKCDKCKAVEAGKPKTVTKIRKTLNKEKGTARKRLIKILKCNICGEIFLSNLSLRKHAIHAHL